jgi:cell division protein FtsZ
MNILGVSENVEIAGPIETVIKVIGAGGCGSNAVNRMIECGLENVQFITANTDLQALNKCRALNKLPIGSKLTKGLGAGGKPEVGENAAMEDREMIENALRGAEMVFITTGMGGGTGTGAAPIIAEVAKSLDMLTVGVVTMPFEYEGKHKMRLAEDGLAKLRSVVDVIITIPNQNVFKIVDNHTSMADMFLKVDDVLRQSIQGISDMITKHGVMNIDFADVREFTKGQGGALIGVGIGAGEDRAVAAAKASMSNPMLEEATIKGAQRILVNVSAGPDFSPVEFQEIVQTVTEDADEEVQVKTGWVIDESMEGRVKVTVVATGFADASVISIEKGLKQTGALSAANAVKGASADSGASNASVTAANSDFLFGDEWDSIRGGGDRKKTAVAFDIDTPAVTRRAANKVSEFESYRRARA